MEFERSFDMGKSKDRPKKDKKKPKKEKKKK
jgi:hypothetical protein